LRVQMATLILTFSRIVVMLSIQWPQRWRPRRRDTGMNRECPGLLVVRAREAPGPAGKALEVGAVKLGHGHPSSSRLCGNAVKGAPLAACSISCANYSVWLHEHRIRQSFIDGDHTCANPNPPGPAATSSEQVPTCGADIRLRAFGMSG